MRVRNGTVSAAEFAQVTKLDLNTAKNAINNVIIKRYVFVLKLQLQIDENNDKVLNGVEFHNLMNKSRIRKSSIGKGERAFQNLDKNKVS